MPINLYKFLVIIITFSLLALSGCAGLDSHPKRGSKPEVKTRLKAKNTSKVKSRLQAQRSATQGTIRTAEGKAATHRTHKATERRTRKATTHRTRKTASTEKSLKLDPEVPQLDVQLNKQYFYGFIPDTIHLVTSPLRWSAKDWLTAGLVAGATVGVGFLDEEIQSAFGNSPDEPHQSRREFLKVGKYFGDGGVAAGYLTLLYLTGMARDDDELKSTVLLAGESFLISGFFTEMLKHLIGRGRPNSVEGPDEFEGPDFTFDQSLSFPSGHTTAAFAIATVFARQYQRHFWVPPLLYSLATMTAVSRINDNVHWASDVVFGAALGYFTASALHKMHLSDKGSQLSVRPLIGSTTQGLALDYRF